MPTYDYECEACTGTLELVQSFHDDPETLCPSCGKHTMRRIISGGIGIVFKGSGFYAKDSLASSEPNKGGESKKHSAEQAEGKQTSKQDSQSASSGVSANDSASSSSSNSTKAEERKPTKNEQSTPSS